MTLLQLVALLGLDEVARRAGVTEATVKRWMRTGVSPRWAAVIAGIIRRTLAARKAVKSRRAAAKWRETVEPPDDPGSVDEEDVIPRKPPELSREVAAIKRAERIRGAGRHEIDSDFNVGYTTWVRVGQDARDVDDADLIANAWMIYEDSGLDYVSVKFMFLRYIPFNPNYKGEMVAKQGKWHEQWVSTRAASGRVTLGNYMKEYLFRARQWAESRIIFLEMIGVSTFNRKRELPTAQQTINKPLRTRK